MGARVVALAIAFLTCIASDLCAQPWCPGNIVLNGGFTNGVNIPAGSDGSMIAFPPGSGATVANWEPAYTIGSTPQIQAASGCRDNNYISMWGTADGFGFGEGVAQAVNFQQGVTYHVRFCARYQQSSGVNFADVQFDAFDNSGNPEVMGSANNITSTAWQNYSFCWTPTRNYMMLGIRVVNDRWSIAEASWANVDNICITPVAPPRITGPETTCTVPSTYCVTPAAAGTTHTWSATNGTIVGSNSGSCVVVNWNAPAAGSIKVVMAGAGCPVTSELQVRDCGHENCCRDAKLAATYDSKANVIKPTSTLNVYTTSPSLSAPTMPMTVKATIISASRTLTPATCGASGPIDAYAGATQPAAPASFTGPVLPVVGSSQIVWESQAMSLAPLSSVVFPFNIQLPPVPSGASCTEVDTLCIVYDFTSTCCRTCSVTRCISFKRQNAKTAPDPVE
jgi:hypothetical protein